MRKILSSALAVTLAGATLSFPVVSAQVSGPASTPTDSSLLEAPPIDVNLIPEELLAQSLKDRGVIPAGATADQVQQAVKKYVDSKSPKAVKAKAGDKSAPTGIEKQASKFLQQQKQKVKNAGGAKAQPAAFDSSKLQNDKAVSVANAQQGSYNGPVRKDKVLVLLADFADFKHNNIAQRPNSMWSDNFSREHYQKMLFGSDPFTLFDGSEIQTFKQYYEEQSGGSYTVDGYVTDWLTVPHTAKEYGDDSPSGGEDNLAPLGPRDFIRDALNAAANSGLNLADFDEFDQYDIDGDGNRNEPDGLVDHLMVIHAGSGQEAGGGVLGDDAIWSHRWNLKNVYPVPNTTAKVDYWKGQMAAFDYTVEPEDGATGVFAHEFGHDLGLPDEYDTQYSGQGEPIGVWSIMSGGSWAGKVPGTAPTSFSPQNKEFFQKSIGGNWTKITEVNYSDITSKGLGYVIDQSVTKSNNPGIVRVNLPDKPLQGIQPAFGQKYYYSNKGDDLNTTMETPVFDLTKATNAHFDFKTYYQIEYDYDYLYVTAVDETGKETPVDTIGDELTQGNDTFDTSNGQWVDRSYDLSQFAGHKVKLVFNYVTDGGLVGEGFAMDNASLTVDGAVVFSDDAEGTPTFTLQGFEQSNGFYYKNHYYYLEWRNKAGADKNLAYARGANYGTGMLVWYGDDSYLDNWTGIHPGEGFLGVVDAHVNNVLYFQLDGKKTTDNTSRYQIADAAFSFDAAPAWDYTHSAWGYIQSKGAKGVTKFDDANNYVNKLIPDAGRNIPKYGLKFNVVGEAADNSAGAVLIQK